MCQGSALHHLRRIPYHISLVDPQLAETPELEQFHRDVEALLEHPILRAHRRGDDVRLGELTRADVRLLITGRGAGYYFLIAAAGLNRTALKKAAAEPEAMIVAARERAAFAIRQRLPLRVSFRETAAKAVALRRGDLGRKTSGGIEGLFHERLHADGIPLLMCPPIRRVPGMLIRHRKPDGVYPDPAQNKPPRVYLEIKNVRRVADDIQKRLYELAEASIEMKVLYGTLQLRGLDVQDPSTVTADSPHRDAIRQQIIASVPAVVGLFLCPRAAAERYRPGAEAFIDRVFFQEEIDECISFLKAAIHRADREEPRARPGGRG